MELYFAPLACSMSTRIAVYEAGGEAQFHCVDTTAKRVLADDSDFLGAEPARNGPGAAHGGGRPAYGEPGGAAIRRRTIFRRPAWHRPAAPSATRCSNG